MESNQYDISRLRRYVAASVMATDAKEAARERLSEARRDVIQPRAYLDRLRKSAHPIQTSKEYEKAIARAQAEFDAANEEVQRLQAAYDAAASAWRLAKRHEDDCRAYALACDPKGARLPVDASFIPDLR